MPTVCRERHTGIVDVGIAIFTVVLGLVMAVFHNPLGEFLPGFFRDDRHSQIAYLLAGIFLTSVGLMFLVPRIL
jgi:hypothetical protein